MLANQEANVDRHIDADWLHMRQALGNRIRDLRIQKGWSQQRLAADAGTRQAKVSLLETGRIEPELGLVFRIARTFELSITELFPADGQSARSPGRRRQR